MCSYDRVAPWCLQKQHLNTSSNLCPSSCWYCDGMGNPIGSGCLENNLVFNNAANSSDVNVKAGMVGGATRAQAAPGACWDRN